MIDLTALQQNPQYRKGVSDTINQVIQQLEVSHLISTLKEIQGDIKTLESEKEIHDNHEGGC